MILINDITNIGKCRNEAPCKKGNICEPSTPVFRKEADNSNSLRLDRDNFQLNLYSADRMYIQRWVKSALFYTSLVEIIYNYDFPFQSHFFQQFVI